MNAGSAPERIFTTQGANQITDLLREHAKLWGAVSWRDEMDCETRNRSNSREHRRARDRHARTRRSTLSGGYRVKHCRRQGHFGKLPKTNGGHPGSTA